MRVLSIETSCDETAIAIVECTGDTTGATFTVLGDALFSQAHLHAEYGGVFPTLAKREHIKNLPILLEQAMTQATQVVANQKSGPQAEGETGDPRTFDFVSPSVAIDLIAVTQGPGLEPALWTGIEFAVVLGKKINVPVYGTDHMEGHIISGIVEQVTGDGPAVSYNLLPTTFPVLALLISGGHTEFVLMRKWFEYEHIGATKDDAVGEAFDKVARMLGLPYPGGPEVGKHAARARARGATHDIVFPRPMANDNTCDFSFSGLKTAVLYKLKKMGELSDVDKEHIAQAFEDAARDIIILKTRRALEKTNAHTLAVGGGVSANKEIREGLQKLVTDEFPDVTLNYPHKSLTGDNALMIGMTAYLRHSAGLPGNTLEASGAQRLAQHLPS